MIEAPPQDVDQAMAFRAAVDSWAQRLAWASAHGITFDAKRDSYAIYGYKRELTVTDYRARYERGGIAGTIVDALPKATWRGGVELVEDETTSEATTEFERQCEVLFDRLDVVAKLQATDILSRLSTYAVLLIGAPGELTEELPQGRPEQVLYLTPFCGAGGPGYGNVRRTFADALQGVSQADAIVDSLDEDKTSQRFGLPKGYRLRRTDFSPANEFSKEVVHWSRVIHVAEDCLDDEVYGKPALRLPWNDLDNLEKVLGGGSEAFFQRANQGRLWKIDKDVKGITDPMIADFKEQIEKFQHNITRDVRMQGVDVQSLGSDTANFSGPADALWTALAGSTRIPKRILTGSEMGELASSQDRDNFRDQINGRREQHAFPYILKRLINRLIDYGYLAKPKSYSARWGSVLNMTEQEKREKALGWAQVNATLKSAGQPPGFLMTEIRDHCYEFTPYDAEALVEEREMMPEAPVAPAAFPRAASAQDEALVEQLAAAIEAGDVETIDEMIGVTHGE